METNKINIMCFSTLVIVFTAIVAVGVIEAGSVPEQEYLRRQQALESGTIFGCGLVLLFMAAVIVTPIILSIMVVVLCKRKREAPR